MLTNLDRYVRWPKSAGNGFIFIEESLASIRHQSDTSLKPRGICQCGKQQIDIYAWTNSTLESIRRFFVLLQLFDLVVAEAGILVVRVLDLGAAELKDLIQLLLGSFRVRSDSAAFRLI